MPRNKTIHKRFFLNSFSWLFIVLPNRGTDQMQRTFLKQALTALLIGGLGLSTLAFAGTPDATNAPKDKIASPSHKAAVATDTSMQNCAVVGNKKSMVYHLKSSKP